MIVLYSIIDIIIIEIMYNMYKYSIIFIIVLKMIKTYITFLFILNDLKR